MNLLVDLLLFKTGIMDFFFELIILDYTYLNGYGTPTLFFAILLPPLEIEIRGWEYEYELMENSD
jgi:hypothetical protein